MARFKTWKLTAEQVRYKSIFPTDNVVDKLRALFMFHPHLSSGITKYWNAQTVKDQLALDNLFVHTETLIKKYMDNFQSEDSYHSNGKGKGKGKANHTETGNGEGGRARSQSADTKDHAEEDVGYTPQRRGSDPIKLNRHPRLIERRMGIALNSIKRASVGLGISANSRM